MFLFAALIAYAATTANGPATVQHAVPAGIPQLDNAFYKMYPDNVIYTDSEFKAELAAVQAAGLTSLTLPYAADWGFAHPSPAPRAGCMLGVMAAFYPTKLPCMIQVQNGTYAVNRLLAAAKQHGILIYLGMGSPSNEAWSHMGFTNFSGPATTTEYYQTYCRLQQSIATELWTMFGGEFGSTIAGFYLNLEVGNTVTWQQHQHVITAEYLDPLSRHIAGLAPHLQPFTSPSVSFTRLNLPDPLTPAQLGAFWDDIFTGAPALSFIAPKDGMGENNNSRSTVQTFYQALRIISTKHGKPFWSDVEVFAGVFPPPTTKCAYNGIRPAPIGRVASQLALEQGLTDKLTAWEWHAFMSPISTQCSWHEEAWTLYADYMHYVHPAGVSTGA